MHLLETDPRILGRRIAEARKARGKTQEEVAEFLGCSRPTYIAIEKGRPPRQVRRDHQARFVLGQEGQRTGPTHRAGCRSPAAPAGRGRQMKGD